MGWLAFGVWHLMRQLGELTTTASEPEGVTALARSHGSYWGGACVDGSSFAASSG